jgi:hypothetical protein
MEWLAMLIDAHNEVERAARRFDIAVSLVEQQSEGLRASVRRITPLMLLGGGVAAGLLVILLPRRLRRAAMVGLGPALLRRVWSLVDAHLP